MHFTRRIISFMVLAAVGMSAAVSLRAQKRGLGTIVLRARVITIDEKGIVATGLPQLSSEQGTMSAQRFTVALGPGGRAETATADGGVKFNLTMPIRASGGAYETETGRCSRAVLFLTDRRAQLVGGLSGEMTGPGIPPITLAGENAEILARTPTRPGQIRMYGGLTTVTART